MFLSISSCYDNLVLGKPRLTLALLLITFVFFGLFVKDFKLDASSDSLMLENDEDLRIFREVSERYETRDLLFVAFTPNDDLFSESALGQIKSLRDELAQLARVESVLSILDVPLVKIVGGKLSEVAKNFRTLEDPTVDREKAKAELLESPIFKDTIVSADAGTTMLVLSLKTDKEYSRLSKKKNGLLIERGKADFTPDAAAELARTLAEYNKVKLRLDTDNHNNIVETRAIMAKYAQYGDVHLGGLTMISDDMITFIKNDLLVFGIGIFVFLVIMLTTIFRQTRWVVLPLMSCVFAGLVMVGFLGLVGWKVTVISSNFISLMLILTMSMNVHLIVRYRQLRRDDPTLNQHDLVMDMSRHMVLPCLYTALTTMIGFASLVVSGIKPVIDFGWMMTIGLGVTFFTSFTLFPAILMLLNPAKIPDAENSEVPVTRALAGFTERHGGMVLVISLLLAVVSAIGISRLKVENSLINYFSESTEIYQGLKLIDDKLGGTTPLDVTLKFDDVKEYGEVEEGGDDEFGDFEDLYDEDTDSADGWFTAYKMERIKAVHDYLDGLPAVGKVLSLASLLRLAEDLNDGEPFDAFELAIINKRAPEELKSSMIEPYISIENNEARINLRILDSLEDLRRNDLLIQINKDLVEKLGLAPEDFQVNGILVLYNNMLQSLFRSQIMTLGVVMLGIALMLVVLFRSVSLAIIGIIPNLLAAAIILGLMGLMNIPLDLMTITIAAVTIGIAVDNSIHYIYRFREEFPVHQDYIKTMHFCHANIGRAVFYTAITIIVGFSIMVMSNFIPTIYFGLLIALAMFIALLAVLTLLPKLILMWKPF
ncbi:MAG: putative RND superfamily exporter protein [Gammaproteobacteria bacterium]|jgi:predicted RND superfamily exporter protein